MGAGMSEGEWRFTDSDDQPKNKNKSKRPLMETYPFEVPRPGTLEALEAIDKAFDLGKKFVLVDALTGAGKSGLAVAFARREHAVILTPTKFLQEQYATTSQFDKEYVVKGKTNYNCGMKGQEHVTVDHAICVSDKVTHESRKLIQFSTLPKEQKGCASALKDRCVQAKICPYYTKIRDIGKVPGAIANYDLIFRLKKYPGQSWGLDVGDTLVLDEAHQLIDKVREIFGFKFSNIAGKRLIGEPGKRIKGETPVEWLERVLEIVTAKLHLETDPKKSSKYDNFVKRAGYILSQELEDEQRFFIEDKKTEFEIKPLDMRFLKGKIFFPFKKILLLSATFPDNFKEVFGIKEEESAVVSIPSQFSKLKRPVYFAKDLPKLNRDSKLTKKSEAITLLNLILKSHCNHKGIIHTGNYKFMDQLRSIYQKNKRFIWVNQDSDKDEMFQKHVKSKKPTILVSPAMMEGVDLKDDLARFGVTLKVPYPMLDPYTKRMMNIFPSWYDNLTATNICQSYGRQVRSSEDWANFYILDGAFWMCINRAKNCYSKYFLEALRVGSLTRLKALLQKEAS